MIAPVVLHFGEGRGDAVPRWFAAQAIASDDGVSWACTVETNDAAPGGLGGECQFTMAYVTIRALAGATLRCTPILDDVDALVRPHPDATITLLQPTVVIPPRPLTVPLQARTYEIPLRQRVANGAGGDYLVAPRGERCRLRFETLGAIGAGAWRIENVELEYTLVRRASFVEVTMR